VNIELNLCQLHASQQIHWTAANESTVVWSSQPS